MIKIYQTLSKRRRFRKKRTRAAILQAQAAAERRPKAKPVPVFNNRFAAALRHFGATLLETTEIAHAGIKGTKREDAVREFVVARLPSRYGVATGQVIDQLNVAGPQLDVLIFDRTRDFSFSDGDIHILAAEALLASIEIKSKLDSTEVRKSSEAARKLRALKPFKRPLAGRDIGPERNNNLARYLHCVFAFGTDLSEPTWLQSEAQRFRNHEGVNEHLIDSVYVLDRGLLNLTSNRGRFEDANGSAITSFYFSILNFVQREGGRRPATPYQDYASLLSGRWVTLT